MTVFLWQVGYVQEQNYTDMNSIGSLIRDCSANDLSITRTINLRVRFRSNNGFAYNLLNRAVEMPCPTCPTWSHFIQDKLKISIYLSLDKYTKVNTVLHIIFWLIITSSHVALKTLWILISWLLKKPADLDLHCLHEFWFHTFSKE